MKRYMHEMAAARVLAAPAMASRKFNGFKPETHVPIRKEKIAKNKTYQALLEMWNTLEIQEDSYDGNFSEIEEYFLGLKRILSNEPMDVHSQDIQAFCLVLPGLMKFSVSVWYTTKAGVFLSALIDACPENKITLTLPESEKPLDMLGYRNRKNLTINGTAGKMLGHEMICGSITVNGDSGIMAGSLMQNGTIRINGDAGDELGICMEGGEIHVWGEICGWPDSTAAGKIFHKGILLDVHEGEG